MEADFFFGPKNFCRLQEALEVLDSAEEADNDVDLVIVPPEPTAETDEEGDDNCIEDLRMNDVCGLLEVHGLPADLLPHAQSAPKKARNGTAPKWQQSAPQNSWSVPTNGTEDRRSSS
ncbi:uncharacterized protein LOC119181933 [Rhipicephalus microplus]|uniref:uncharacterized protein LOC119181933 n=1 Tax=Rhipicephalus microplus TaxID=6941 RepID=UPI003F6C3973